VFCAHSISGGLGVINTLDGLAASKTSALAARDKSSAPATANDISLTNVNTDTASYSEWSRCILPEPGGPANSVSVKLLKVYNISGLKMYIFRAEGTYYYFAVKTEQGWKAAGGKFSGGEVTIYGKAVYTVAEAINAVYREMGVERRVEVRKTKKSVYRTSALSKRIFACWDYATKYSSAHFRQVVQLLSAKPPTKPKASARSVKSF